MSPLGRLLESAGELLPGIIEESGEEVRVSNVLKCYDCFDHEHAKYKLTPNGTRVWEVFEHAFNTSRVGSSSLFKIPETKSLFVYTMTGRDEIDFYSQYNAGEYTGLAFEKVWEE